MSILRLLSNDNFIAVNRTIAEEVGLEAAVVLGELASEYNYWQNAGKLEEGYFYSTIENLEKKTYLSGYNQRQALAELQEKGWISITKKGVPAKRYIKVNEENLILFFNNLSLKNLTTGDSDFERQEVKKFDGNKNINNENIEKEIKEDIPPIISPEETRKLLFKQFWEAYPKCKRKVDKKGCERKFIKIENLEQIFPDIMASLETWKREWIKNNNMYVPLTSKWINQEWWTASDERTETQTKFDEAADEHFRDFFPGG